MLTLNIGLALNLIILFLVLFFKNDNTLPNKVLALILLDTAISFLGNATIVGGYFFGFPFLFFLSWCTSAYFGPLVFAYTCLFTGSRLSFKHPVWLVAFFTSVFGLSLPIKYFILPIAERTDFARSLINEPLPWQITVVNVLAMLLIWASLIASLVKIAQYRKRLVKTVSNLEKSKLAFITRFVSLVIILTLLTTILYITLPQYMVEYLYLPSLIVVFYLFVFMYTFRHHTIFTAEAYGQFLMDTLPASEEMATDGVKLSVLPKNELQVLAQNIEVYLVQSAIYTDPDLTIGLLAKHMKNSTEKISAAINKEMNKNFFDLINEKRVEKAKVLLGNKIGQLTIESIGYEAGFNSRASFYRAFKKRTSLTPSEYLSRQQLYSSH